MLGAIAAFYGVKSYRLQALLAVDVMPNLDVSLSSDGERYSVRVMHVAGAPPQLNRWGFQVVGAERESKDLVDFPANSSARNMPLPHQMLPKRQVHFDITGTDARRILATRGYLGDIQCVPFVEDARKRLYLGNPFTVRRIGAPLPTT